MTETATRSIRLPISVMAEAERLATSEGSSLDQFVASALAGEVVASRAVGYFAERRGRADWVAFDRIMARDGGEPPRPGDEVAVDPA